jgi:hypothetical protein
LLIGAGNDQDFVSGERAQRIVENPLVAAALAAAGGNKEHDEQRGHEERQETCV